ncbi:MAG: hypothetical protein J7621_15810 [Niastella sp.]|nr:hypothetical protein [Niastella sp.]
MTRQHPTCSSYLLTAMVASFLLCSCSDPTPEAKQETPAAQSKSDSAAIFTWATELCENKGSYDPELYNASQLQNTYDLWFALASLQLDNGQTVYEPKDIATINLQTLTTEYEKKKEHLQQAEVIHAPFWQQLKKQRLKELDDEYALKKATLQAFLDPATLKTSRFAKDCPQVVAALTADTATMLAAWKSFTEEQKAKNGAPEVYMAKFYEKYNSPQRITYAMIDLITFSFGNCANNTLVHTSRDSTMENEFNKLFTDIKTVCDEP